MFEAEDASWPRWQPACRSLFISLLKAVLVADPCAWTWTLTFRPWPRAEHLKLKVPRKCFNRGALVAFLESGPMPDLYRCSVVWCCSSKVNKGPPKGPLMGDLHTLSGTLQDVPARFREADVSNACNHSRLLSRKLCQDTGWNELHSRRRWE